MGHSYLKRHSLSTDVVVQYLGWVEGLQRRPAEGEDNTIQEDKCDESIAGACANVAGRLSSYDVDGYVDESCEEGTPEEERSAAEEVDGEGASDATQKAKYGVQGV